MKKKMYTLIIILTRTVRYIYKTTIIHGIGKVLKIDRFIESLELFSDVLNCSIKSMNII